MTDPLGLLGNDGCFLWTTSAAVCSSVGIRCVHLAMYLGTAVTAIHLCVKDIRTRSLAGSICSLRRCFTYVDDTSHDVLCHMPFYQGYLGMSPRKLRGSSPRVAY